MIKHTQKINTLLLIGCYSKNQAMNGYYCDGIIQQFQMRKNDPKVQRYMNLEGYLEKKATNKLLGFQMKFWKILENGTKIGYSNERAETPKPENIFIIKECLASQSSGDDIFQLQTRNRLFFLKAPNEQEKIEWIKALTFLKKLMNNQIKLKPEPSPTQTTLASHKQRAKTKKKTTAKFQSLPVPKVTNQNTYKPEDLKTSRAIEDPTSGLVHQLSKFMPEKFIKYNTLITQLKVRSQGIFMDSYVQDQYLLISPKSLYPQIHNNEQNLSNVQLPPWLQINIFYKIVQGKQRKKEVFSVCKIVDLKEGSERTSLQVNTGEIIHEFFNENIQQKQCLKNCLQVASANAKQVIINGKFSKRNFDFLIQLHQTQLSQFESEARKIVLSFVVDIQNPKLDPKSLFCFLDDSMTYLKQFIEVLENKIKKKHHVVLDMLKIFHQQVKTQVKLTWVSNYLKIKGVQILNVLKKLSQYYKIMSDYIKSRQFQEGMRQLSKIYVRQSWKNFESIIISIVDREKSQKFLEDQFCQYIQTYGIIDLFKFIYSVYDIAFPNWEHKVHLHNVNKLMQRALQEFVNLLRSTIDEQVIPQKQLIAISNNFFSFKQYTQEFYQQKFEKQLIDKTKQSYDKIISNYREVSMIILDKIAGNIGHKIQQYCKTCTLQTIKCQKIQEITLNGVTHLEKFLHRAFQKKLYEKIMKEIHQKICLLVADQVQSKKKLKIPEILRCIKQIKAGLMKVFSEVTKSSQQIQKNISELQKILTADFFTDIETIVISNPEPTKSTYMKILGLRQDYHQGSPLYKLINDATQNLEQDQQNLMNNKSKSKNLLQVKQVRDKNATFSKLYVQEWFQNSEMKDDEKGSRDRDSNSNQKKIGLISEGYLIKGKRNHKFWQKQYFRLKNEHLYIFQNKDSKNCHNQISVKNIMKLQVSNPSKTSFLLTYNNLGKQKQIKLKAQSIQMRDKWVNSIQLQRKRLLQEFQVKKKTIKYRQQTGKKKNQMIIDFYELEKGKDYFSYGN